jgi:hypothetical protein
VEPKTDGVHSTFSKPDFSVTDEGTVFAFDFLTDTAREWVEENVSSAPWQWMGPKRLVVDRRFADFLAATLIGEGFFHV